MSTRVAAPLEYALLSQSNTLVHDFAKRGLHEMAVNKLLEHKLATKNFKAGISFDTSSDMRHGFRKILRLAKNQIIKELTWIDTQINPGYWLVEGYSATSNSSIVLTNDPAIPRYIRMMQLKLIRLGIPIVLNCQITTRESICDSMTVTLMLPSTSTMIRTMYRLFLYLPESIRVLKTISRKALFRNEAHRTVNRYRSPTSRPVR